MRKRLALLAVVAILITLGGCGDGGSVGNTNSPATRTSDSVVTAQSQVNSTQQQESTAAGLIGTTNADGSGLQAKTVVPPNSPTMTVGVGSTGGGAFERMGFRTNPAPYAVGSSGSDWGSIAPIVSDGSTHPAAGNIDGDSSGEVAIGGGAKSQGIVKVFRNLDTGYQLIATVQLAWDGYNNSNDSSIYPAFVDIDGDGKDELVLGLSKNGSGWVQIFKWNGSGFVEMNGTPTPHGWLRSGWDGYDFGGNTETHPAGAWLKGRGVGKTEQLVLGLGPASFGWVQIWTWNGSALVTYSPTPTAGGWFQLPGWPSYCNSNDASIWPAAGDVNGDGIDDLVFGLGKNGQGWIEVLITGANGLPGTSAKWLQVAWQAYNTSGRAGTHPAVKDIDSDGKADIVVGLDVTGQGWIYILRTSSGVWVGSWAQLVWSGYNSNQANAPTFPAIDELPPLAAVTPTPSPSPSPITLPSGTPSYQSVTGAETIVYSDPNGNPGDSDDKFIVVVLGAVKRFDRIWNALGSTAVSNSVNAALDNLGNVYVAQCSSSNAFCNVDSNGIKGTSFPTGLGTQCIAFEPGFVWVSGTATGTAKKMTTAGADTGVSFTLPGSRIITSIVRLSDRNQLAVASFDGTLWIYDESSTGVTQLGSYVGGDGMFFMHYRPGTNALYVSNMGDVDQNNIVHNAFVQLVSLTNGSVLGTLQNLPNNAQPQGIFWHNGLLYVITGVNGIEIAIYNNP